MKEFIKNFYTNNQVNQQELIRFINEYCELNNKPITDSQQINIIIQLLQSGFFNLNYAIDNYIKLKNINLTKIYDKNNNLINVYIN
jgi:hypothetical protein